MLKNYPWLILILLTLSNHSFLAQAKKETNANNKLVVGIVVDQMRNDYIYRYWSRFGNGGFKRLINEGFYFKNAHYNYIPTYTGPGHASIYTGAMPRAHGIIANDWFAKNSALKINCVSDSLVKPIGLKSKNGMKSPKNLLSSTIGDELKMSSNQNAKVFGIALKDRSAILAAGRAANAAFWMDETSGEFISSSWYLDDLPRWLKNFNDDRLPKAYLDKWWATLYPIESYSASISDDNKFEQNPFKKEFSVFPYEFKNFIEKNDYSILKFTPSGNSITKDLAIACLIQEELGKDEIPDLLCISFSSTDYIGHTFGPRSVEIEDTYLRLDKDLEELLNKLDKEVGKGNYSVFLTADHGAADVPNHLIQNQISAGYIKETKIIKDLKNYLLLNYGDSLLLSDLDNDQIYLNEKRINALRLNKDDLEEKICAYLLSFPGISEAFPSKVMKYAAFHKNDPRSFLQNGYNQQLSGNICYLVKPGWIRNINIATEHGSAYSYDTHVPVIFFGNNIPKGENTQLVYITQIAATLCELLKINQPNSANPEVLQPLFGK